ncbi:hypothetical protein BDZ94DRAFT_821492 [Collybia nuda]|uniref:Uncharacterized protein n=1 Tax=Collybia nuda TaxID=64659 RepID=A0A9P6CHV6_9AGAR|nr:hypothetical protein BDZ94DRAFT_821492 [Collybia nuda]
MTGNNRTSKRRRTSGINSRFDEMVEIMSVVHRTPSNSGERRRAHSNSSSSQNNLSDTQTSIDTCSTLQGRRLGKDFTLIKMGHYPQPKTNEGLSRMATPATEAHWNDTLNVSSQPQPPPMLKPDSRNINKPLPLWLCDTISTLVEKHPLRLLLPEAYHKSSEDQSTASRPINATGCRTTIEKESIFGPSSVDPHQARTLGSSTFGSPKLQSFQSPAKALDGAESVLLSSQDVYNSSMANFHGASLTPNTERLKNSGINPSSHYRGVFQTPKVIPFSAPGPGSMVSLAIAPPAIRASGAEQPNSGETLLSFSDDAKLSYTTVQDYASPIHVALPNSHFDGAMAEPLQKQNYETSHGYSSDDISDYFCSHNNDSYTDESTSDPPICHDAYILPNFSRTPGPGYHTAQSIYFDSPAENPVNSDHLHPGYKIDYETLDFHWAPFNREATSNSHKIPISAPPILEDFRRKYSDERDYTTPPTTVKDKLHYTCSPGPFRYHVEHESFHEDQNRSGEKHAAAFAPAPGIFISPLRDPLKSETRHKKGNPNIQAALVCILI